MNTELSDLLKHLEGHWNFTREIRHVGGQVDLVDGTAGFERRGDAYLYNEVGTLRVADKEFRAERQYIWREEGDFIQIYFKDMRPFHGFSLVNLNANHFCDPDQYMVDYQFEKFSWRSKWNVSGPKKAYVMITDYIK